jgi:hypothetical protein
MPPLMPLFSFFGSRFFFFTPPSAIRCHAPTPRCSF